MNSEEINIIITISGDPSSGKTTTIKELEEEFKKMGFQVELKFVGKDSRPIILEAYRQYLKRHPGKLRKDRITIEDAHADEEFSTIIRKEIDELIDRDTEEYGKRINSKYTPNVVYIIDGRLAWNKIPNSFAVRTIIDEIEAGKRAFRDESRGFKTEEEARIATIERKKGERERYKLRYEIDLADEKHYNLVLDTTHLTPKECASMIIEAEREHRKSLVETKRKEDEER